MSDKKGVDKDKVMAIADEHAKSFSANYFFQTILGLIQASYGRFQVGEYSSVILPTSISSIFLPVVSDDGQALCLLCNDELFDVMNAIHINTALAGERGVYFRIRKHALAMWLVPAVTLYYTTQNLSVLSALPNIRYLYFGRYEAVDDNGSYEAYCTQLSKPIVFENHISKDLNSDINKGLERYL